MEKLKLTNNVVVYTLNSELYQALFKLLDFVEKKSEESKNKKTNYKKFPKSHKNLKEYEKIFLFK